MFVSKIYHWPEAKWSSAGWLISVQLLHKSTGNFLLLPGISTVFVTGEGEWKSTTRSNAIILSYS